MTFPKFYHLILYQQRNASLLHKNVIEQIVGTHTDFEFLTYNLLFESNCYNAM